MHFQPQRTKIRSQVGIAHQTNQVCSNEEVILYTVFTYFMIYIYQQRDHHAVTSLMATLRLRSILFIYLPSDTNVNKFRQQSSIIRSVRSLGHRPPQCQYKSIILY